PDARFASMRELMSALRTDPLRHRRSVAMGAAVAVALLVTGAGAQRVATRGQRMCRGAADRMQGIWELDESGTRRTTVYRAFLASSSPIAEDTWTRVAPLLDDYARRWTTAYTDTCEATHVRGDQSAEVLDLRMTCLDGARSGLRALTDILSHADTRAIIEGVNAVHALPPLERCADLSSLRAVVPPPAAPAVRTRIAQVEKGVADAKALIDTGQWFDALARIEQLAEAARSIGYDPLLAEVLETRTWLEREVGQLD